MSYCMEKVFSKAVRFCLQELCIVSIVCECEAWCLKYIEMGIFRMSGIFGDCNVLSAAQR